MTHFKAGLHLLNLDKKKYIKKYIYKSELFERLGENYTLGAFNFSNKEILPL